MNCSTCVLGESFEGPDKACVSCDLGQFGGPAAGQCSRCPVGFYQNDKRSTSCKSCVPGKAFVGPAQPCSDCSAGRFGNDSMSCHACPAGRQANKPGRDVCQRCDGGEVANADRNGCTQPPWGLCTPGAEYLHDTAAARDDWTCAPCPVPGADCAPLGELGVPTLDHLWPAGGWWRVPLDFFDEEKVPPPSQAGRLFVRCPFPKDCDWEASGATTNRSTVAVSNTRQGGGSGGGGGGQFMASPLRCARHTKGPLCATCKVGYDRMSSVCERCRDNEVGIRVGLLFVFLVLLGSGVWGCRRRLRRFHSRYASAWRDAALAIKILVSFTQINMSLPSMLSDFAWPDLYLRFLNRLSVVQIELLPAIGVQCLTDVDYRFSVLAAASVPLCVVLVAALGYGCNRRGVHRQATLLAPAARRRLLGRLFDYVDFDDSGALSVGEFIHLVEAVSHHHTHLTERKARELMLGAGADDGHALLTLPRERFLDAAVGNTNALGISSTRGIEYVTTAQLRSTFLSGAVQMLLLFHAPVSAKAFLYFDCPLIGDRRYLRQDRSMLCHGESWFAFLWVALLLMVLFALGLPLLLGHYLFAHRRTLHTPLTRHRLGWLYARYTRGNEAWDVFELCRKMILTGMLVYLPPTTRGAVAILVSAIALCVLNYRQPQQNRIVFWVCEGSYVLTLCKYLVTTLRPATGTTEEDLAALSAFLIGMDVAVILGSFGCVLAVFVLLRQSLHKLAQRKGGSGDGDNDELFFSPPRASRASLSRHARVPESDDEHVSFHKLAGAGNGALAGKRLMMQRVSSSIARRVETAHAEHVERRRSAVQQQRTDASARLSMRLQKRSQTRRSRDRARRTAESPPPQAVLTVVLPVAVVPAAADADASVSDIAKKNVKKKKKTTTTTRDKSKKVGKRKTKKKQPPEAMDPVPLGLEKKKKKKKKKKTNNHKKKRVRVPLSV